MDTVDYARIGQQIRDLRLRKGLTIRRLAELADVNKATVVRLEKGLPVRFDVGNRICNALNTDLRRVALPSTVVDDNVAIHRRENELWMPTQDRRPERAKAMGLEVLNDESERLRLGHLGFVTCFGKLFNCALPDGSLVAGVVEVFEADKTSRVTLGEIFILCLRGSLRFHQEGKEYVLREGDAATFLNRGGFYAEPVEPVGASDLPPIMLYVRRIEGLRPSFVLGSSSEQASGTKRKNGKRAQTPEPEATLGISREGNPIALR